MIIQRCLPASVPVHAGLRGSHPLEWACPDIPVSRVWAVPKTSFPTDDVDLEVFVCGEGFPAFCLKRNPKPLESAGDRTEEKLVLAHLRADSGADGCVSGVHIGCIAAGAPHCHMFLNLHKASPFQCPRIMFRVRLAASPLAAPEGMRGLLPLEGSCNEPSPFVLVSLCPSCL